MGKFTWLYENEASMIVQKVIKPSIIFSSETVNHKPLFLDLYENGISLQFFNRDGCCEKCTCYPFHKS